MNNIAEGYSRDSTKDTQHFFYISLASCSEVRSMTYVMEDLNSINKETNDIIRSLSIETQKMLHAFIEQIQSHLTIDTNNFIFAKIHVVIFTLFPYIICVNLIFFFIRYRGLSLLVSDGGLGCRWS